MHFDTPTSSHPTFRQIHFYKSLTEWAAKLPVSRTDFTVAQSEDTVWATVFTVWATGKSVAQTVEHPLGKKIGPRSGPYPYLHCKYTTKRGEMQIGAEGRNLAKSVKKENGGG